MQPEELARDIFRAIGQPGHMLDEDDVNNAGELIEVHGPDEVRALIPAVVRLAVAESASVFALADLLPFFVRAALERAESAPARERNEREWKERRQQRANAQAEKERLMAAFEALPRKLQRQLLQARRAAHPKEPEDWIKRLAAKDAMLMASGAL